MTFEEILKDIIRGQIKEPCTFWDEHINRYEKQLQEVTEPSRGIALLLSITIAKHLKQTLQDLEVPQWMNEETMIEQYKNYIKDRDNK